DSYSSGKTYSVMALAHWRSVAHPFPKWPCDSCRVHTADRIAQPRRSRSAVRTLRNRQRVFTQGHLVPRQDFSARRISSFFNLNIFCFLWSFRGFAARIAVSTSDTCATNIGRATSFAKTQRREGAKKFNCISLRLRVIAIGLRAKAALGLERSRKIPKSSTGSQRTQPVHRKAFQSLS